MSLIEWMLLAVVCTALVSIVWTSLLLGISPMPTSRAVRAELLSMVDPHVKGEIHELGAGWGTLAFAVADRCPEAQVIAHEASWFPFFFCRLRQWLVRRPNLVFRRGDFHRASLQRAQLAVAYLFPAGMMALAPKFDAELPAGAQVLSHTFAWPGKGASEIRRVEDLYRTPIYRYVV